MERVFVRGNSDTLKEEFMGWGRGNRASWGRENGAGRGGLGV